MNAFLPLIADSLLESVQLLTRCVFLFRTKCIDTFQADEENFRRHLEASTAFAASYLADLGYDTVSQVVKEHSPGEAKKLLDEMRKNAGLIFICNIGMIRKNSSFDWPRITRRSQCNGQRIIASVCGPVFPPLLHLPCAQKRRDFTMCVEALPVF